jgi:hypothetical protein
MQHFKPVNEEIKNEETKERRNEEVESEKMKYNFNIQAVVLLIKMIRLSAIT